MNNKSNLKDLNLKQLKTHIAFCYDILINGSENNIFSYDYEELGEFDYYLSNARDYWELIKQLNELDF